MVSLLLIHRSIIFAAGILAAPLLFIVLLLPTVAVGEGSLPPCSNFQPEVPWDNCQGTFKYPKGNIYVGEFRDGKPNGQGAYTLTNGDKYIGEYKDGKWNGRGTY